MKLGIVADVHCNIEGLRTALELMGPVDELICAGDAVHQFRFSNEVLALLRERDARYILGNHERVLLSLWGERARSAPEVQPDLLEYMAAYGAARALTVSLATLRANPDGDTVPTQDWLLQRRDTIHVANGIMLMLVAVTGAYTFFV